jgi:hypothetical protein
MILKYPGLLYTANRVDKHLMKFENMHMDTKDLDKRLYMAITASLLQYTRNVFSTKAMAAYVLNTIKKHQAELTVKMNSGPVNTPTNGFPQNILYISHQDHDMDKASIFKSVHNAFMFYKYVCIYMFVYTSAYVCIYDMMRIYVCAADLFLSIRRF